MGADVDKNWLSYFFFCDSCAFLRPLFLQRYGWNFRDAELTQ